MNLPPLSSFYTHWRLNKSPSLLEESAVPGPPERWLQWIWQHQRLRRDQLKLMDGRPLRVLHPGFWNHEAGPDFRNAMVRLGNEPVQQGDVEIDLQATGWRNHGHHRNPAYDKVILHVLWERPVVAPSFPPALVMSECLEASLEQLTPWIGADSAPDLPPEQAGRCAEAWRQLTTSQRDELLHQAALVRMHGKALQLLHRARVAGWEQALWEGIFRALGYKHNTWPMQNLGELRPRLQDGSTNALHWQSRLLGVGGLLPIDVDKRRSASTHARQLWDWWWRDQEAFGDCLLPRHLWRLGGLRPVNHPQRRLALAAQWLSTPQFFQKLEQWFHADHPMPKVLESLLSILAVQDDFWEWHWNLNSQRLKQRQPLLGESRTTDLAVNVLLPWFYARGLEVRDRGRIRRAEQRYLSWPAGEDNAVLKLARQRMLGGTSAARLNSAAAQQGLLQIVRDCCDQANTLCDPCLFPDLVRQFIAAHPTQTKTSQA